MSFDWKKHATCPIILADPYSTDVPCIKDRQAMIAEGERLQRRERELEMVVKAYDSKIERLREALESLIDPKLICWHGYPFIQLQTGAELINKARAALSND